MFTLSHIELLIYTSCYNIDTGGENIHSTEIHTLYNSIYDIIHFILLNTFIRVPIACLLTFYWDQVILFIG